MNALLTGFMYCCGHAYLLLYASSMQIDSNALFSVCNSYLVTVSAGVPDLIPLVTNDLLKAALQLLTFERAEIVHTELLDIISSIMYKHIATAPAVKDVLLGLPNMTHEVGVTVVDCIDSSLWTYNRAVQLTSVSKGSRFLAVHLVASFLMGFLYLLTMFSLMLNANTSCFWQALEKGFQQMNTTSSAKRQRRIVRDALVGICGAHMRALAGQKKTAVGLQVSEPHAKNSKSPSFYDAAGWDRVQWDWLSCWCDEWHDILSVPCLHQLN